jgi:NTP pyrophosphatase (non-canonical NTP hydrolase)
MAKDLESIQKEIKEFCQANNLNAPAEHRALDLVSEVGEVAKEILKMSDYGTKNPVYREEVKLELGDALFSLIVLSNQLDTNLNDSLTQVLEKYSHRLQKGSAGSESE